LLALPNSSLLADDDSGQRHRAYDNRVTPVVNPKPLLADHPEFVEPIREAGRFEAPMLVDDKDADLDVRAWRFSYNARGIIEMPNRLRAARTAVIVVHPWGIDDGRGWKTPEPAGVAFACTPEKNRICREHMKQVVDPFLNLYEARSVWWLIVCPAAKIPFARRFIDPFALLPPKMNDNKV